MVILLEVQYKLMTVPEKLINLEKSCLIFQAFATLKGISTTMQAV